LKGKKRENKGINLPRRKGLQRENLALVRTLQRKEDLEGALLTAKKERKVNRVSA